MAARVIGGLFEGIPAATARVIYEIELDEILQIESGASVVDRTSDYHAALRSRRREVENALTILRRWRDPTEVRPAAAAARHSQQPGRTRATVPREAHPVVATVARPSRQPVSSAPTNTTSSIPVARPVTPAPPAQVHIVGSASSSLALDSLGCDPSVLMDHSLRRSDSINTSRSSSPNQWREPSISSSQPNKSKRVSSKVESIDAISVQTSLPDPQKADNEAESHFSFPHLESSTGLSSSSSQTKSPDTESDKASSVPGASSYSFKQASDGADANFPSHQHNASTELPQPSDASQNSTQNGEVSTTTPLKATKELLQPQRREKRDWLESTPGAERSSLFHNSSVRDELPDVYSPLMISSKLTTSSAMVLWQSLPDKLVKDDKAALDAFVAKLNSTTVNSKCTQQPVYKETFIQASVGENGREIKKRSTKLIGTGATGIVKGESSEVVIDVLKTVSPKVSEDIDTIGSLTDAIRSKSKNGDEAKVEPSDRECSKASQEEFVTKKASFDTIQLDTNEGASKSTEVRTDTTQSEAKENSKELRDEPNNVIKVKGKPSQKGKSKGSQEDIVTAKTSLDAIQLDTDNELSKSSGVPTGTTQSLAEGNNKELRDSEKDIVESVTQSQGTVVSKTRACLACIEDTPIEELITFPCAHAYCVSCVNNMFSRACLEESSYPVHCCPSQPIALKDVENVLTTKLIVDYQEKGREYMTASRKYCSQVDCGAYLRPGYINGHTGLCIICFKHTCTMCKQPDHGGVCPEDEGAKQAKELMKLNGWQECFHCGQAVAKVEGCNDMKCICETHWCYRCREPWQVSHYITCANVAATITEVRDLEAHRRDATACTHTRGWRFIRNGGICGQCEQSMPDFIYTCYTCRIPRCKRCSGAPRAIWPA